MAHHGSMQGFRKYVFIAAPILVAAAFIGTVWATQPRTPTLPYPPLKDLAAHHGIQLGNFAIRSRLHEEPYKNILTQEFNLALADNTPNWYFTDGGLHPARDQYNFAQMDEVVGFAEQHKMAIQAHHFLWGEEKWLPEWLKKGNFSHDELNQIIRDHIHTVGSKYKGRIAEWTVVNEAFTRGQHMYGLRDWWADATGGQQYIDDAFTWAREADPNAKLILNDFQNEQYNDVSNAMYDYIKGAKARGVPIDGIGMQMHIDGTHPPTKDEVISNMKRFGDLGVRVYVTEFDVNMNDLPAGNKEKDEVEGRIYYEMMRACIESKVCNSFAILGITDAETWYNYMGLSGSRPLPFDTFYQPKPAYYKLREALEQQ